LGLFSVGYGHSHNTELSVNQFMTPGLYAVMPEIVETAISSNTDIELRKSVAKVAKLQEQYGYAQWKKSRPLSPISIPPAANK
jgi:hypothetical protein